MRTFRLEHLSVTKISKIQDNEMFLIEQEMGE